MKKTILKISKLLSKDYKYTYTNILFYDFILYLVDYVCFIQKESIYN